MGNSIQVSHPRGRDPMPKMIIPCCLSGGSNRELGLWWGLDPKPGPLIREVDLKASEALDPMASPNFDVRVCFGEFGCSVGWGTAGFLLTAVFPAHG